MKKCHKRLIYISPGNIPSRWTHTFQIMKQSEAMSGIFDDFSLLTARGLFRSDIDAVNLNDWYGIERSFRIVRLPAFLKIRKPYFTEHEIPLYDRLASWYSLLRGPDVVYSRSPCAARYCIELSIKTIFETHAPGLDDMKHLTMHANTACFLGLVTVTEELRHEYVGLGIPQSKVLVLPDAIDLRRFAASPDKRAAREILGLPTNERIVVYCGHLYPEKGVDVLVEASRFCPETRFYFVGGWPEQIERMKSLTAHLPNVSFIGFEVNSRIPIWLASADILALPNSAKFHHARVTSPMKLYEYMASRRPIIATSIPALVGVLHHRESAFLVEPDSAAEMADAIHTLLGDERLASEIAAHAWAEVQRNTWENRALAISEFFGLSER